MMIDFANITGTEVLLVVIVVMISWLIFLISKLLFLIFSVKDKVEQSVSYVEIVSNLIKKIKGKK